MDKVTNFLKESTARKLYSASKSYGESDFDSPQLSTFLKSTSAMAEMYYIVKEKLDSTDTELQKHIELNTKLVNENQSLKATVNHMKDMLKKCIPTHIILFLIVNVAIMTLSATLAVLFYGAQFYIVDIYYILCTFIISTTLFCTALRALADWRKMLYEK